MKNNKYDDVALEVAVEAFRASTLFPPMNSSHEAAAVIREEFDEYWDEVKKHNTSKPDRDTRPRQREELIQLAAMCIRAITDTIDKNRIGGCSECQRDGGGFSGGPIL